MLQAGSEEKLFELLAAYPSSSNTFNQYRDVHPTLDRLRGAEIRRHNLRIYLEAFVGARTVLVGEAAGYAGCRFSGIPFTCESQFMPPQALIWTIGRNLQRSSQADTPWTERSAKMVWEALDDRRDCVLWNAFPWHPFTEGEPLSNRPPRRDLSDAFDVLACFLDLFPSCQAYAVGRVAERALAAIGIEAPYIRHPSRGGKSRFVAGVAAIAGASTGQGPAAGS